MIGEICDAIEKKALLEFQYKGHRRIVEPHAYGMSSKRREVLRAYQIEGTSSEGKVPDWRLFSVDKIVSLKTSNRNFTMPRNGYARGDSAMAEIYCEL